jgi:hypothetical protein
MFHLFIFLYYFTTRLKINKMEKLFIRITFSAEGNGSLPTAKYGYRLIAVTNRVVANPLISKSFIDTILSQFYLSASQPIFLRSILMLYSHLLLGFQNDRFTIGFPTEILYALLVASG